MRFNNKIKLLDYLILNLTWIGNRKIYYCSYCEDYLFNQNGELLIIGCTSYKNLTIPIIIKIMDLRKC